MCGQPDAFNVNTYPGTQNQYGTRVFENLVINPSTPCGIVRSVFIEDNAANYVEVGWFENNAGAFQFEGCQDFANPHVLVYAVVLGDAKCKANPPSLPLSPDPIYSFKVDNPDHDHDFVYYYDDDKSPSISLGFFATDHTNGFAKTTTERHDPGDSLRGDFFDFNSLGGMGEWHDYPDSNRDEIGNVGGWEVCSWSGHHLSVKLTCPP